MTGNALLHTIKVFVGMENPQTQTTQKEREAISKYSKGAKKAVEIGVFEGVNTSNIAGNLAREGILYAVDPFSSGRLGIKYGKFITKSLLKKDNLIGKVVFVEKFSYDAAKILNDKYDFIFIDGDHSAEGITKDWEDWSYKLEKNGIIALHDTNIPPHDPTVADLGSYKVFQTVIKNDPRFDILETVDSLNILRLK
jgi:predicted O-methyltransferase YrrM